MDLPEAERNRNRGLPSDKDPPSVRLPRPSVPNSDAEHDEGLDAFATLKESETQPLPASPGVEVVEGGVVAPRPLQVAPSNVGHRVFSDCEMMHRHRQSDDQSMTLQLGHPIGGHDDVVQPGSTNMNTAFERRKDALPAWAASGYGKLSSAHTDRGYLRLMLVHLCHHLVLGNLGWKWVRNLFRQPALGIRVCGLYFRNLQQRMLMMTVRQMSI